MLKQLEVKGSPFDRGVQMGRALKAGMGRETHGWAKWPADPATKEKYKALIPKVSVYLQAQLPEILEEMQGIAQGASIAFEEAFLLSAGNSLGPAVSSLACTSIGFMTSDVGPILGKTDDGGTPPDLDAVIKQRFDNLRALTIRPDHGYDTLCVTPLGTIWSECGINAKGLCIGTSSGHPERTREDGGGIPQHIIPRLVLLHCADVNEAIEYLKGYDTMGKGINLVLVDEKGNGAAIEAAYTLHGVRRPTNGVIFATNHYFAPEMQVFTAQTNPEFISSRYFQNSVNRVVNLLGRFGSKEKGLTFAEMKSTLMDHHNPGAICQHPEDNDANFLTYYSAILVSKTREMWLNEGKPCLDRFERYMLAS